jgi:hypothetical protein
MGDMGRHLSQARKSLRLQCLLDMPIGNLLRSRILSTGGGAAIELELILGNLRIHSSIAPISPPWGWLRGAYLRDVPGTAISGGFRIGAGETLYRTAQLGFHDPIANGVPHEIRQRAEAHFSHDVAAVRLRRFHGDIEDARDLLIAPTLRKQLDDLPLAW